MRPHEKINLSLSTLIFSYNLHFSTFRDESVKEIHREHQIIDGTITSSKDFSILTNNSLLATFQSHAILLQESIKTHSLKIQRSHKDCNDVMYPIRQFVDELRHAHAHIESADLQPRWDEKKSKKHLFQINLPVTKTSVGTEYNLNSPDHLKLSFRVIPGRKLQLNQKFIGKIILFSFHLIEVCSFRKLETCNKFLKQFKFSWKDL